MVVIVNHADSLTNNPKILRKVDKYIPSNMTEALHIVDALTLQFLAQRRKFVWPYACMHIGSGHTDA